MFDAENKFRFDDDTNDMLMILIMSLLIFMCWRIRSAPSCRRINLLFILIESHWGKFRKLDENIFCSNSYWK